MMLYNPDLQPFIDLFIAVGIFYIVVTVFLPKDPPDWWMK